MKPEPRRELLTLPPAVHGALDFEELRRLGREPDEVLDFSANTNPYGPSPRVREVMSRAALERYPDREALALREALAAVLGVAPAEILAANGSSELVWLVALAFLRPRDRVLVLGPTFGEYERAAALMGASVTTWRAEAERDFAPDGEQISRLLDQLRPRVVFLCNPNNPTGAIIPRALTAAWTRQHPRTLFVVDEAYLAFARGLGSVVDLAENVLVLRSMTKDFGLAGLRLGYALGPKEMIGWLARVRPPWSVNALAQAAGVAALQDPGHLERALKLLAWAKTVLVEDLATVGLASVPSAVHFFLVRLGDGAAFRSALLRRGILVRDGASFGLPDYVRIATRRPEDNARLLEAVRELDWDMCLLPETIPAPVGGEP